MKTKKFLMTSLLVMGMIIAKAANGFPPELVLVSQPVLTYNANSVTIYYDVQNIGDYTYRGDVYVYLDPDDGYYYARKRIRVCPGRIKRIAMSIPAYRANPSWVYTVMPYYELGNELYSFTTFEYFEPVRFHWYGYRNEPWVVIHVGPKPRHYHRPSPYRYYYDGYRPMLPPPPGGYPPGYFEGLHPLNPAHHTYAYHHNNGGYPANHHPDHEVPGYNHNENHSIAPKATVRDNNSGTPGSLSSTESNNNSGNTSHSLSGRANADNNDNSGRVENNDNNGRVESNSSSSSRPSGTSSSSSSSSGRSGNNANSGRSGNSSNSGRVDSNSSRPSSGSNSSSSSGRSGSGRVDSNSSSRPSGTGSNNSSSSGRSGNSSSSGRSGNSSNSSRSGSSSSNGGGRTPSGSSRGG